MHVGEFKGTYPTRSPKEVQALLEKHAKAVRARDEKLAEANRSFALAEHYDKEALTELAKSAIAANEGDVEGAKAAVAKSAEAAKRAETARSNGVAFADKAQKMTRDLSRHVVQGTRAERRAIAKHVAKLEKKTRRK